MQDFLERLKNIVRFAKVTGPADNSQQFPIQQITYKGKVANSLMVFPYGSYANVSSKNSLALLISMEGNEDNKASIAYTPQDRPDDLEEDEVAFYHPYTKSFIKFRNTGDIEIDSSQETPGDIIINTVNATVNASEGVSVSAGGDVDVNAGGDVNVGAGTEVNIDAPSSFNVDSPSSNLGVGGPAIARVGDSVQVTVTSGSSAGTYNGTITSGGANTSI